MFRKEIFLGLPFKGFITHSCERLSLEGMGKAVIHELLGVVKEIPLINSRKQILNHSEVMFRHN